MAGVTILPDRSLFIYLYVRSKPGILRRDGGYFQAEIPDLRHTFAVHCLKAWLREGKDLRSMLPILAAYLGMFA